MTYIPGTQPPDQQSRMFSELLPYVLPAVPTCSNMLAVQNLRRAAIDLCQISRIWRTTQHPLPVDNSMCEYEFEPLDGADRVRVEWLTYEGRKLEETTERQLFLRNKEWIVEKGKPTHFMEMETGYIRLYPTPSPWLSSFSPPMYQGQEVDLSEANSPCSVVIRISQRPTLEASGMDTEVLTDHYNAIVNGALAYLYFTPNHPWTNPEMGNQYQAAFNQGIARATYQAVDGNLSPKRVMGYGGI